MLTSRLLISQGEGGRVTCDPKPLLTQVSDTEAFGQRLLSRGRGEFWGCDRPGCLPGQGFERSLQLH